MMYGTHRFMNSSAKDTPLGVAAPVTDRKGDDAQSHAVDQLALQGEGAGDVVGGHEHSAEQQAAAQHSHQCSVDAVGGDEVEHEHAADVRTGMAMLMVLVATR